MDREPNPGTQDPGPRIEDRRIEDQRTETKSPDPGLEICDQGLGFILHTLRTFLARIMFVTWKYFLQINIDINISIFIK